MSATTTSVTMPVVRPRQGLGRVIGVAHDTYAVAVADTGWCFANTWSHPGMLLTWTNAEDANTSGASTGNAAAWADSGSPTISPTAAKIHAIV